MRKNIFLPIMIVVMALIFGTISNISGSTAENGIENAYDKRDRGMIVRVITDEMESSAVEFLADSPVELCEKVEYDVSVEDEMVKSVLEEILDTKTAIVRSNDEDKFDFPKLEVEHSEISYRASLIPNGSIERDMIVLSFFPKNIPSMAACAFVIEDISYTEIYLDSTWMMIKRFESLWGKQRYLWSIKQQYLISRLFEPKDAWTQYLLPSEHAVTEKMAQSIAADELVNRGYLLQNETDSYIIGIEYIAAPMYSRSEEGVWFISYYKQRNEEHELVYSVVVDGITGEVLEIQKSGEGLGQKERLPHLRGSQVFFGWGTSSWDLGDIAIKQGVALLV